MLQISRKMIPTTSLPPFVNSYGLSLFLRLRPLIRSLLFLFSMASGLLGSSSSGVSSS